MIHKYYEYIGKVPEMMKGIVPESVESIVIIGGIVPFKGIVPELVDIVLINVTTHG